MKLMNKISRGLRKFCLQPVRVYCFHHICKKYDGEWMHECDWMSIEEFQRKVLELKRRGVVFVSLTEAYRLICMNRIRFRKYAVVTFDDGYATIKEILSWLKEQDIPATLFVNTDYAAGKAHRESDKEQYLSTDELALLDVEIGMHGLRHVDVSAMNENVFREFAKKTVQQTSDINHSSFIPFWAYTWGRYNAMTEKVLREKGIVSVRIDGMKNYNDTNCIHRELL